MKIIIAILVFSLIIAIHEFGHFIVAKLCKIKVNEFAIGMGPAIFKRQWGETLYALRIFPIGGFCSMEGEDEVSDDSRAFNKKPIIQRIAVLVAGAFMNILLGFIIILIIMLGSKSLVSTTVSNFHENASSSQSGLMLNDKILKINGMRIWTDSDIVYKLTTDTDGIVSMEVLRDGKKITLDNVKFVTAVNEETGKQTITIDFTVYPLKKTFTNVLSMSFGKTASVARLIWISLIDLISGKYGFNELSGPVGIVDAIGQASSFGIVAILNLVVFITINVGVFNLLPLPALDGGRIIFRIIEAIIRKPIKPEHEGMIHFIGLAALMTLMVLVTVNDVRKLF